MMRFYSVLLVFVFTGMVAAQEINWISMEAALAKQKEVPKKIMVDMYTAWCGPCRMLDKNTFSNKKLGLEWTFFFDTRYILMYRKTKT